MRQLHIYLISLFIGSMTLWSQDADCVCCSEEHRAFDFWIGSWEVTDKDGKVLGTNNISQARDGCVLVEDWKSANGTFTGGSTNFYNKRKGQWEQLWLDNAGTYLHLKGNRTGNDMILESEEIDREDKPAFRNRITWTLNQDGTVRQLWEIVVGDEVETVAFDGIYSKK